MCWVLVSAIVVAVAAAWAGFRRKLRSRRTDEALEREAYLRTFRHDLLSPLNAVGGYLELLEESSGSWDESSRAHVRKARSAFERTMEVMARLNQ